MRRKAKDAHEYNSNLYTRQSSELTVFETTCSKRQEFFWDMVGVTRVVGQDLALVGGGLELAVREMAGAAFAGNAVGDLGGKIEENLAVEVDTLSAGWGNGCMVLVRAQPGKADPFSGHKVEVPGMQAQGRRA